VERVKLKANERIDDLQYKGLKLIQKKDGFCFGIDAVLLANFADVKKGDSVIDLGTGTGVIPILIAGKTQAKTIVGLEIQREMAEMADRSVKLNRLEERIKIVCGDIKDSVEIFGNSNLYKYAYIAFPFIGKLLYNLFISTLRCFAPQYFNPMRQNLKNSFKAIFYTFYTARKIDYQCIIPYTAYSSRQCSF
jgi:tRNA G37 N-methylase Trm5